MPELPEPEQGRGARARQLMERSIGRLSELATHAHPLTLKTWQVSAGAVVVGLAITAGAVIAAGPWDSSGQRTAERDWAAGEALGGGADHGRGAAGGGPRPAPSAPPVLTALGTAGGTPARPATGDGPTRTSLGALLGPLLDDSALGTRRSAAVVDVATGKRVYGNQSTRAQTPASTTKLATAVAALSAMGPDHRIATRTVLEPASGGAKRPPRLVLVGGGDPTLTAHKDAHGSAGLRALADATARELKAQHVSSVLLRYDTSLYTGPRMHPIGPNENLAPVTALMADEGRLDDSSSGTAARSTDPAGDAARAFSAMLRERGVKAAAKPAAAKATGHAREVATVFSPPLSSLVERMLTNSDNDIAEALARQTALAAHRPVSFAGGADAIRARLAGLGLPMAGARFADGSGLNRADRLSADLLASLLAVAGDPERPELRSVLTGLPVAGFTGTLETRYRDRADAAATGLVRAKTGTLTGVNTLAGTVVNADGRVLAFAFMTTGSTTPTDTQSSLDHLATSLTTCACRE